MWRDAIKARNGMQADEAVNERASIGTCYSFQPICFRLFQYTFPTYAENCLPTMQRANSAWTAIGLQINSQTN